MNVSIFYIWKLWGGTINRTQDPKTSIKMPQGKIILMGITRLVFFGEELFFE